MTTFRGRWTRPSILNANPWGGDGDKGGGDGGPRNPWAVPPGGRKGPQKPTALDEFLAKARRGGPGGGGFPAGLPNPAPRSLLLIGAGLLLLLWLVFTSFHAVAPQERAVVTRLGSYSRTLGPGSFQPTLPAPFETVEKLDVTAIREENFPEGGGENLVLTGDQNLIDLAYQVRWSIGNAEDYVFQLADPHATVRAAAESAMREAVANVTLDQAIGPGRTFVEGQVQDRMQRILDEYNSGIQIRGVAIKQADPPERVNEAFKDVTAAQQDASALRNQAQAYAQQKLALAQGEAASFNAYYEQYRLAPEVTRRRMYYETMEDVLARNDKTIVEAPGVTPYLPLDRQARRPAEPQVGASQAPASQSGGSR